MLTRASGASRAGDRAGPVEELLAEREFLLASLRDLQAEHAAGDLSDDDYAVLRDRYTVQAAAVLRRLADLSARASGDPSTPTSEPAPVPTARPGGVPPVAVASDTGRINGTAPAADGEAAPAPTGRRRPRRRAVVGVAGVVCLVAAAVLVAFERTGVRLPGDTGSGGVSLSSAAQLQRTLDQADTLNATGNVAEALALYQQVLRARPNQPEALAEAGHLEFAIGLQTASGDLIQRGQADEERAVAVAPGAWAPRLYLASMLLTEGDDAGAAAQFARFLADSPPPAKVQEAAPYITQAYTTAGLPPPKLPGVSG